MAETPNPPAPGPTVVAVHNGAVRDAAGWLAAQLAERSAGLNGAEVRLDFGAVEYVESGELGALVVLNRQARDAGGRLALVDVRPLVAAVFEVTRLDTILDVRRAVA
jgi:anti-anti-sigma factor